MKAVQGQARITLGMSLLVGLSMLIIAAPRVKQPSVSSSAATQIAESRTAQPKINRAKLPLSFEPNLGQTDSQVKFLARGSGYKLFLTTDEAVLQLKKSVSSQDIDRSKLAGVRAQDLTLGSTALSRNFSVGKQQDTAGDRAVLRMRLVGANRSAAITGLGKFPGTSNYFIGNDPTKWRTKVPNYARVQYESIYPGVDLVYYGSQSNLEYDFVVAPGADPGQINLAFEVQSQGQPKFDRARLDNGDLVFDVDGREVRFHKPVVYQRTSKPGVQTPIEGSYVLRADNRVQFELGQYDRSKPLVIDPVLSYSTYLGGNDFDQAYGIAIDASGNILLAGTTASTNFPTANAFQSQLAGSDDAFVTKFNSSGTSLIYSTYIGGSSYDFCESLALSAAGNAYITGYTASHNFPTLNPVQPTNLGSQNIFMSQLDPNGNLVSSTFYGGSKYDTAYSIAVDSSGVYVVGNTTSTNYPTKNAFQPKIASAQDAFLTKFSTDGTAVLYSTYLGGTGGGSSAYSVTVDSAQSPYLAGQTHSPSFPTLNAYQATNKSKYGTVFVTKFAAAGNTLAYSTYLGGSNTESAGSIALDASDNAYIAGGTESIDFPTLNPFQAKIAGAYDVFVAKLNSSGNALVYSTYIGGTYNEFGDAIAVDSTGNAHVAGYVYSNNFPTVNPFQLHNNGSWNAFVLELNSAGNALIYSSYLGGSMLDIADNITLDSSGNTWVTGAASSTDFPVTGNALQFTYGGGSDDAYLAQVSAVPTFPLTVSLAGTGTGTVTSSPSGINCGAVCSNTFISGTVTLTATPTNGSIFSGWSGACTGAGTCNVNLTSAQSVTATFTQPTFTALISFGTVSGNDPTNPKWPGIISQGLDGNLYSTTPTALGTGNRGALFYVTPSGTLTTLTNSFGTGSSPQSGLVFANDGNFYGTTYDCSFGGNGTIFRFTPGTDSLTTLYTFTGSKDGKCPTAPPILGSDGNFYGTTYGVPGSVYGTVYQYATATGKVKPLHDFASTDGANPGAPVVQANTTNVLFYGVTQMGGSTGANDGNFFSVSSSGTFSVPLAFSGSNGQNSLAPLVEGSDGNFYGTTVGGGANGLGEVFKMTPGGKITILHSFAGTTDGAFPYGGLALASDGNFYGTTSQATSTSGCGTIYKVTSGGAFSALFTFPSNGSSGCNPQTTLVQHTNGTLYGDTNTGGSTVGGVCAAGCGTFFSFNYGLPAFITLQMTSGSVGSTVGILGQGFTSSSVVEFNGVPATTVVLTGTTYLTATVPAGASTGFVTVTTGGTTLTSLVKYTVHNSWTSGAPIPVPVAGAASGVINGNVYVVGGIQTSGGSPVNNNQEYIPTTNTWTTAPPIPTPVYGAASAVYGFNLLVIGGFETSSGTPTNLVQEYTLGTNSWSTLAAMPTARGNATAVVDGNVIYVFGGVGTSGVVNNLEAYAPLTNVWAEEAPLPTAKSGAAGGLLAAAVVAADGATASGVTGDNRGYKQSNNSWVTLASDANPRSGSCGGALSGMSTTLYVAGGLTSAQSASTLNESYNFTTNSWTSLASMPTAAFGQASSIGNGVLYCIGGQTSTSGAPINNVQIYQP
jgi:uncharacterized repeat protein (TIGR03803 family)